MVREFKIRRTENKRVMKFITLFVARPGHDPGTS